jgi:YfiH family protein
MERLIYPDIFSSDVKAFFTTRVLGADTKKICNILSIQEADVFLPIQRHTSKVFVLESDSKPNIADAVITKRKGILIGVKVADCVPILLHDRRKSVIGSVHAGWRGTAAQIIKKTIIKMEECFLSSPQDIDIALGPSIRRNCYIVEKEVKDSICEATGDGGYFRKHTNGKYSIDLASANVQQALSMGVLKEHIWISDACTYCSPRIYYSYRYGKDSHGRQGGFIGIL